MAFLAAVLLLNMEEIDAFICFANLINRPMQMAFFSVDQPMVINGSLTVKNFCGRAFKDSKMSVLLQYVVECPPRFGHYKLHLA